MRENLAPTFCLHLPAKNAKPRKQRRILQCMLLENGRQHGQVVSASDLQSSVPRFKSCSGHLLDLFSVVASSNPRPHL